MDNDDIFFNPYHMRQLQRFPSSHHGSALTFYPQRHVINLMRRVPGTPRSKLIEDLCNAAVDINERLGIQHQLTDDPVDFYQTSFTACCQTDSDFSNRQEVTTEMVSYLRVCFDDIKEDLSALARHHPGLNLAKIKASLSDPSIIDKLSQAMRYPLIIKRSLESVRNRIQQSHIQNDQSLIAHDLVAGQRMFSLKEMVFIVSTTTPRTLILINYDQLLMVMDTVSSRFMTRFASTLNELIGDKSLPPWSLIDNVYRWGDILLATSRLDAYAVIGEFESIVTGVMITFRDSDPLGLGSQFLDSLLQSALDIEQEYGVSRSSTIDLIALLRQIGSINWLSEIFGLRKHWGNPMVEARASGRSVQEKVSEELPIHGSALIKLLASFNRMITLSFISQHGVWPKCVMPDAMPNCPLKTAFRSGNPKIPETAEGHIHEHWAYLKFMPNCILDTYKDDLALVSDKAVSPYLPNLDTTYVRSLCHVPLPTEVPEDRRLVLEYLRKDRLSIHDIFKMIMTDNIPAEWLANCASMKGTEMKHRKARIFAVLTYELRQYFAATEDIIKKHLFRYNPHQTMTMTETDLLSKLKNITKQLDPTCESRTLCVMHIVDFSKWNLRMRYKNTALIFRAIDDFLGTPNLIEKTHEIFSDMTNMVQDPFNPPFRGVLNTESDTIWRNHNCGWEGQRQKGWTILTSALLSDIARTTGIESEICGQGDNQTLLSKFPVPEKYRNPSDWIKQDPVGARLILDRYYERLDYECQQIGLKIKTAETCRSLTYFNYGKRLYFGGTELSMTLKRMAKNITEPNDSYPTAEGILKTLEGTAFAAGLYSHPGLVPYIAGRFALIIAVDNAFCRNQLIQNTGRLMVHQNGLRYGERFLRILLKIPSTVGGVPQLQLPSYLYRGHPDPLCTDLVMLVLKAAEGNIVCRKIQQVLLSGKWFNDQAVDKSSLIDSPYSLNLKVPLSSKIPIRNEVVKAMKVRCGNRKVSAMFADSVGTDETELVKLLGQCEPCQPLVLNDLYSRTVPGRRQAFVSGLANTTSLGRLVQESTSSPMILKVQNLELAQLEFWISQVKDVLGTSEEGYTSMAHHILASRLRDLSWKTKIVSTTVPHPLEQFVLINAAHDMCSEHCEQFLPEHICVIRHSEHLSSPNSDDGQLITMIRSKKGNPYLGSRISEGMIQQNLSCLNPDNSWRDVIRLNVLRKWMSANDSDLSELILQIIKSRTDVQQSIIDAATGMPSRLSYNHRAHLMKVIPECHISTTSNMHTRIYLSSNRMGRFSHGDVNYHLAYGPTFLCYQSLLTLSAAHDEDQWSPTRTNYHVHVRADDVQVVYDGEMRLTDMDRRIRFTKAPPVLFASSQELQFETKSGLYNDTVWEDWTSASLTIHQMGYAHQLIADSFVRESIIRESITHLSVDTFSSRTTPISIGDVSLVTVNMLITTLAWNFLLLGPRNLWGSESEMGFGSIAASYIDLFSTRFWEPFLIPLSNPRLLQRLLQLRDFPMSHNLTLNNQGCLSLVKSAIRDKMWQLKKKVERTVNLGESSLDIPIFASSLSAARLLFSKYASLVVGLRLAYSTINSKLKYIIPRDFGLHALCVSPEKLLVAVSSISHDYLLMQQYYELPVRPFPSIKFYSLQVPWVDRLRYYTPRTHIKSTSRELRLPDEYPPLEDFVSIGVDDRTMVMPLHQCDCVQPTRPMMLHSECYHLVTGKLSKSHIRLLDIALSFKLDLSGLIALGTSTGSEAAATSSLLCNRSVYVSCYLPLTSFSSHMAGSYTPAAFLNLGTGHKLVASDKAATVGGDLLNDDVIGSIIEHTFSSGMTGIMCDAELPYGQNKDSYIKLMMNLNRLARSITTVSWMMVKIPAYCDHFMRSMMSLAAINFRTVSCCLSGYSRPRSGLIYIVAFNRRVEQLALLTDTSIPVGIIQSNEIYQLYLITHNRVSPGFLQEKKQTLHVRSFLHRLLPDSSSTACERIIPGWSRSIETGSSRLLLIDDLDSIISTLHKHARSILQIAYRTHNMMQMPRNSILHIGDTPLHKQLNQIFIRVALAELLAELLRQQKMSFVYTQDTIYQWLSSKHQYEISKDRTFTVEIDQTRFINITSRYIYEVLGHVYGFNYSRLAPEAPAYLFHHQANVQHDGSTKDLDQSLSTINRYQRPDLKWMWKKRSFYLTWMLASHLVAERLYIRTTMPTTLAEFKENSSEIDILIWPGSQVRNLLCEAETVEEVELYASFATHQLFAIIPIRIFSSLAEVKEVTGLWKCPWSGLVPDIILVRIDLTMPVQSEWRRYPNFYPLVNKIFVNEDSLSCCKCWDCCIEVLLIRKFKVRKDFLDKWCSLDRIESVLDESHKL